MEVSWIRSPTGRRVLEHWADPRPAWLWSADGQTLLWRNIAARLFPGKARKRDRAPVADAIPIRGQISRLIRLGSLNRASLSRMQFIAGDRPISATCACTPLTLADGQTGLLVVNVDPIDAEQLERLSGRDAALEALFPLRADYLLIDDDGHFAGGSPAALERHAPLLESEGLPELDGEQHGSIEVGGRPAGFTRFKASPQDASLLLFDSEPVVAPVAALPHAEAPAASEPLLPFGLPPAAMAETQPAVEEHWPEPSGPPLAGGLTSLFDRLLDDSALFTPLGPEDEFHSSEAATHNAVETEAEAARPEAQEEPKPVATEQLPAGTEVTTKTVAAAEAAETTTEHESNVSADAILAGDDRPAAAEQEATTPAEPERPAEVADEPVSQALLSEATAGSATVSDEAPPVVESEPAAEAVEPLQAPASDSPKPVLYRVVGRSFTPLEAAVSAEPEKPADDDNPASWAPEPTSQAEAEPHVSEEMAQSELQSSEASSPPDTGEAPVSAVATPVVVQAEGGPDVDIASLAPSERADAIVEARVVSEVAPTADAQPEPFEAELAPAATNILPEAQRRGPPPSPEPEAAVAVEPTEPPDEPASDAPKAPDPESVERVSRYNFDELSRILNDRVGNGDGVERGGVFPMSRPALPSVPSATPEGALVTLGGETLVLNRLPLGILVFRDQQVLFANRAITEMTGYDSVENLRAAGLSAIFPAAGGETQEAGPVNHIVQRDGMLVPVTARLQSVSWQGKPALMLSASMTEVRTGHEAAVRAFAEVLAATRGDGFIETARSGVLTQVSADARLVLRRTEEQLLGRPLSVLAASDQLPALREFFERPARFAETARPAISIKGAEPGLEIMLFAQGQAGVISSYFGFVRRAEPPALPMLAPPADTDPALLARLSRGVRRPLNTVIGFSDLIGSAAFGPVDNERYLEYARDIKTAGLEIAALVDELDDFARLRDGRYTARPSDIDLGMLLETSVTRVRQQANAARVLVRSAISENLPRIRADRASLAQAILNLLASAIDQTPQDGSVVLSAQVDDEGGVTVNVRDSAHGFADLGERFVVFRDGLGRDGEVQTPVRSSVGLALTRALLAVNQSTLSVDPAAGAGTLFSLAIPAENVVQAIERPAEPS